MTPLKSNIALSLVLHNEAAHIPRFVKSIQKQTIQPFNIYVTDNNSSDNSVSLLKELLPEAYINLSSQNLGFAAAHNQNIEKAFSENATAIFILNTDIELDDNCLSVSSNFLTKHQDAGISAPMVLYGNSSGRTNLIQNFRISADFKKGNIHPLDNKENSDTANLSETAKVNYITGTACVMRKEVFEQTGGFDESNFLYGEEMDFCYRASLKDIQMVALRDAKVWHYHDWSKKNREGLSREYYYINRNRIRYFKKHGLKRGLCRFIVNEIFISPLRIRWALKKGGRKLVCFFYLGIIHGLKGYNGKANINFYK